MMIFITSYNDVLGNEMMKNKKNDKPEKDDDVKDAEDAIDMFIVRIVISEVGLNPTEEQIKAFFKKYPTSKRNRKLIVDAF